MPKCPEKKPSLASIKVGSFQLPPSSLLSENTNSLYHQKSQAWETYAQQLAAEGPDLHRLPPGSDTAQIRQRAAEIFYRYSPDYLTMRASYPVTVKEKSIDGVLTEVFTPKGGVVKENTHRVLINLHGGGFVFGARTYSHLESIPIAALGKIPVISVDYRMAPEHRYPAAMEDVLRVYKALLADYLPENIGLYGSSAGAVLTSQVTAALIKEQLPLPAAVGMFFASAHGWHAGDSAQLASGINPDYPMEGVLVNGHYFSEIDDQDPRVFPGYDETVLSQFPPALLLSGFRDFALSPVLKTHSELTRLGVAASLNVWDGLGHTFHYDSQLAESQDAYRIIVDFFDQTFSCHDKGFKNPCQRCSAHTL